MFRYVSILALITCINLSAQEQVKWEVTFNQDISKIEFKAKIQHGWHLYAAYVPNPNDGPLPTLFSFKANEKYSLIDSIIQQIPIIKYDKNFGVEIAYYEHEATFFQKIKLVDKTAIAKGNINYMTCNETTCIPFNFPFEIKLNFQD